MDYDNNCTIYTTITKCTLLWNSNNLCIYYNYIELLSIQGGTSVWGQYFIAEYYGHKYKSMQC